MTEGLARSVHVRLVRHAHNLGVDPNLVFTRYTLERFLYRLSSSGHRDGFILKGAMLMLVWLGEEVRPTRDADLLALESRDSEALRKIAEEVCRTEVQADGVEFDPSTIRVDPIRRGDPHGGRRVTLVGHLGKGRYRVQVDIGLGDAVVPEPDWIEYPTLLDFPAPRLRAYRPETAIAEKVHAMVELGERNTRIRDFLDVYTLARESAFDGEALRAAITATFARRNTAVPVAVPIALSDGFAADRSRRSRWRAFLRRSRAGSTLPELPVVVQALREFLLPVLIAAGRGEPFEGRWEQGGPWR